MQIHVVQSGESIAGIAQLYGTTVQAIVQTNQIPDPNRLVVGQAMVIPIWGVFIGYNLAIIYGRSVNDLVLVI